MPPIMRNPPVGSIVTILLMMALGACTSKRDEQLLVSCQNHRAHLNFDLRMELQGQAKGQPPYESNVPGYEMLAKYAGRKSGGLNCNHGALGSRIGGWQAVNLPPEMWRDLHRMWSARGHPGQLPFYWCGKPNRRQVRVFCTLWPDDGGGWFVDSEVLTETELRARIGVLNECLALLGVTPVAIDIPGGVTWAAFDSQVNQ